MQRSFLIIGFLICLGFTSCLDDELEGDPVSINHNIHYLTPEEHPENYPNDLFRVIGIHAYREVWEVVVEYGGGCGDHEFYIWWDGQWSLSLPTQASFYVFHDNQEDHCKALVRDTLRLDLANLFNSANATLSAQFSLINGYNQRSITIDPALVSMEESTHCDVAVTLTETPCETGIWGDYLLKLKNSPEGFDQIWLQPIRNSVDIEVVLTQTDPLIDFQLFFGYDFPSDTSMCENMPAGTIIPALITCLHDA